MNASKKNSLIWNAVPTIFQVPNPPPKVTPKRAPPKRRLPETSQRSAQPAKKRKGNMI